MPSLLRLPPPIIPGPASRHCRSQFHWRAADLAVEALSGQAMTLSRSNTGGYVRDTNGRAVFPAANLPRWHHFDRDGDGVFEYPTLLLEPRNRNLLLRSEEFDNAAWTKTRSSISANGLIAPNGLLVADKLVEDSTASNSHYVFQNVTLSAAGHRYALSVFARAAERTRIMLRGQDGGSNYFGALFDLSTLVVTPSSGGTSTYTTGYMEPWYDLFGTEWYRCVIVGIAGTGTTAQGIILLANGPNPTDIIYTGDGASGLHLWGAQLEETDTDASSYMPTTTATVLRDIESFTCSWPLVPGPLTMYYRGIEVGQGIEYVSSKRLLHIGDSTTRAILQQSTTVQCINDNGPSSVTGSQTLNGLARLTELEMCGVINPDGSCTPSYCYDRGAVVTGSPSAALSFAAAYGGGPPVTLGLGSQQGTGANALLAAAAWKVLPGAWSLEAAREVI